MIVNVSRVSGYRKARMSIFFNEIFNLASRFDYPEASDYSTAEFYT